MKFKNIKLFFIEYKNYFYYIAKSSLAIDRIEKNKGVYVLTIKLRCKNIAFNILAIDLYQDKKMLYLLNSFDIRTACYYALVDDFSNSFKKISICFDKNNFGKIVIKNEGLKKRNKIDFFELENNERILNTLTAEDALKLGYFSQNQLYNKNNSLLTRIFKKNKYELQRVGKRDDDFFILINNGNISSALAPIDIVNNDDIIKNLEPKDVESVCYQAFLDKRLPKSKIINSEEDIIANITIKTIDSKMNLCMHNFLEFINNKNEISQLSPTYAFGLGRAMYKYEKRYLKT